MKTTPLLWLLLLMVGGLQAQDPVFSQFYSSPLVLNPAFAGITYAPRISANYRSQWAEIDGGYATYALSYEQSLEGLNSGIGLLVMADDAGRGLYKSTRFNVTYGYKVQVTRDFNMKIGVQAGLIQSTVDWDRLVFVDQVDRQFGYTDANGNTIFSAEERPDNLTSAKFDISAGLLAYGGSFYGGIALHHMNQPDENFLLLNNNLGASLPMRITAHAGTEINLLTRNKGGAPAFISPNVLFMRQGDFGQINAGAYLSWGKIFGGAWYRHAFSNPDAAIALVGVRQGALRVGYSYDFTISGLASIAGGTGGTHEISLTIAFDDDPNVRRSRNRSRISDCLKMFQ